MVVTPVTGSGSDVPSVASHRTLWSWRCPTYWVDDADVSDMRIQLGLVIVVLASTASAQSLELPFAGVPLAQSTGEADRGAAGNGSMGIGGGIDYLDDDQRGTSADPSPEASSTEQAEKSAEAGHGGNETDMEHRRRPKLEKHSD